MREILFRGKRTDNGEWVYGTPILYPDGNVVMCRSFKRNHNVSSKTVGQYTGMTDKNGRKIFEGDIVEGNSEYFTYTHPYGKVVYDGGQYLISFDDVLEDIECLGAWANDVEIIGNIYDNPELLEVKK